ncbi:hypothetical protein [Clostridium tetani]|uniref:hypothetical protein n=1 Tax=Clostridium tetani TaxID=1513 RepID=UPI002953982C|nr:hypothetical protein [Clostridium tetani]
MSKKNVLVCKNRDEIIISNNGKRLVIYKGNTLFDELLEKTKEEIKEWFINR